MPGLSHDVLTGVWDMLCQGGQEGGGVLATPPAPSLEAAIDLAGGFIILELPVAKKSQSRHAIRLGETRLNRCTLRPE